MAGITTTPAEARTQKLAQLVAAQTREDGLFNTACPGLAVSRVSTPMPRLPIAYKPSLCVVVQGQKQIYIGSEVHTYNPQNYLVVPLAMPLEMEIKNVTPENPLLGLGLELDLKMISELLLSIDEPVSATTTPRKCPRATYVSQAVPAIQDALIRLLELLDTPEDLRVLGPSTIREIVYRLLQHEQGGNIRKLVQSGSNGQRVASLIRYLNSNYGERLSIEDIASQAGMSTSSLHQKFRDVTGLSPLQYLKKIRLHNARAAMVEQGLNAREAGYKVGYSNPSQFSREFKRMFGAAPGQLVKSLLD